MVLESKTAEKKQIVFKIITLRFEKDSKLRKYVLSLRRETNHAEIRYEVEYFILQWAKTDRPNASSPNIGLRVFRAYHH